jgi:hypothetical protein
MRDLSVGTRDVAMVSALLAACLALGLARPGRAECTSRTYSMTLPEQASLKLCFKGLRSQQVCTYKACTRYGFTGKTS